MDASKIIQTKKVNIHRNPAEAFGEEVPAQLQEIADAIAPRVMRLVALRGGSALITEKTKYTIEDGILTIREEVTVADGRPIYDGEVALDDHRSEAYNDGVQDALAGKQIRDNPFNVDEQRRQYQDWLKGWQLQISHIIGVDISVLMFDVPSQPAPQHTREYAQGFEVGYEGRIGIPPHAMHSYEYVCWKDGYQAGQIKRADEHSWVYRTALVRGMQDDELEITDNPYPFGCTDYRQWEMAYIHARAYYAQPVYDLFWRTGWLNAFSRSSLENPYAPMSKAWRRYNLGYSQGQVDRKRCGIQD